MAVDCVAHTYQPEDKDGIRAVFDLARRSGRPVCLRGGGNSYGDAAIIHDGIVLDLTRMDRVLAWDPETGIIDMEPGVTIQKMWKYIIADGWWPPVVSGTMFTTVGGCAAMNIHGKNNYKVGTFGEHILEFDFLTSNGERHTVTELFHSAISGAGLLGVFTRIRMQMKKVYSGMLSVEAFDTANLQEMADEIEARTDRMDYLVGWIDCVADGRGMGRGIVHAARYLNPGEDPRPSDSLNIGSQELPDTLLGVIPKALLHHLMSPFINNIGVRLINSAKFHSSKLQPHSWVHYQSHGAFAFLLDYVPGWKLAYKPVGLIQYQAFIPRDTAVKAFEDIIRTSHRHGLPPYLGVFKKHRVDRFLLSHAVDGYSLALDFRVTPANRGRIWNLAAQLDEIVLNAGGQFYFAKDATLTPENTRRFLGDEKINRLRELKQRYDPEHLLQTELSRRLFPEI
jgi:FAD/FMN-containing dehydrogenase